MINLKEERDSLKAQLQHERGNILLVKSQYEDTLKHQREMLNETRNELKNLVTSTNSETAFVSNRLGEKNPGNTAASRFRTCSQNNPR
jgi:general stress protein 26